MWPGACRLRIARGLLSVAVLLSWLAPAHALDGSRLVQIEGLAQARPMDAYQQMYTLWQDTPPSDPQRWRVTFAIGVLAGRMNMASSNEEFADALRSDARAPAAAAVAVAAACVRATLLDAQGQFSRSQALLSTPMQSLPESAAPQVKLQCHSMAASAKESMGDLEGALRSYKVALSAAEALGHSWVRVNVRLRLAYALFRAGHREQIEHWLEEARAIAEGADDAASLGSYYTQRSVFAIDGPDALTRQREYQMKAIEQWRMVHADTDLMVALSNLSDIELQSGDFTRALDLANQAIRQGQVHKQPDFAMNVARVNKGLALIGLQRKDEGVRAVMAVIEQERKAGDIVSTAEHLNELGSYLERLGHDADAYRAYAEYRQAARHVATLNRSKAALEQEEQIDAQRREAEAAVLRSTGELAQAQLDVEGLRMRMWLLASVLSLLLAGAAARAWWRARRTVDERQHAHAKVKAQAEQDPLTGLTNRRAAEAMLNGQSRMDGALYMLDVDHFKNINDHFGHATGDALLVELSHRLSGVMRAGDLVARWGGEEFLLWLPKATPAQAQARANRLLQVVAGQPCMLDEHTVVITASIGFVHLAPGSDTDTASSSWAGVLQLADALLYRAKGRGRNRAAGVLRLLVSEAVSWQATIASLDNDESQAARKLFDCSGPLPTADAAPQASSGATPAAQTVAPIHSRTDVA